LLLVALVLLALAPLAHVEAEKPANPPSTPQAEAAIEARLREAVRQAPGSFEAHHALGEFYIRQGKLGAAIPHLEKAQAIEPSHDVNAHDLALAYLRDGRLKEARTQIQRSLLTRDTAELRNLLGDALEAAGNLLEAADEYQKAAHMDSSEENLFDWGNNLLQLRAYPQAMEVLTAAVRRQPRSARLQVGLGIAQYSSGQYEDAIRSFCRAADLDPRDPRPYLFLGEMYGISAELSGEITRRLAGFVASQPRNALGHFYYAMSLWNRSAGDGPPPEAELHLRKAARLDPGLEMAHFQLGVLYSDRRRYPEAIAALREAIRLAPDMAQAHYRLAQAYRRTGREDLARKELETFERLQQSATPSARPPGLDR
jgi:tetratricopeptide (TPR) repeat protein